MAGIVVIFDFDKTIVDVDSDNWVIDELGFTDLFNQLLPTMPWNPLMDKMMKEMHSNGKTIDDIVEVLKRTPIHPRVVPAIKTAHALGCELRIVSDANLFFIETILEHLEIKECFSEINTNPGFVDEEEGRLRILPRHDLTNSSHEGTFCPPNMCKGLIVERIQSALAKEGNKKIIYLGDGAGKRVQFAAYFSKSSSSLRCVKRVVNNRGGAVRGYNCGCGGGDASNSFLSNQEHQFSTLRLEIEKLRTESEKRNNELYEKLRTEIERANNQASERYFSMLQSENEKLRSEIYKHTSAETDAICGEVTGETDVLNKKIEGLGAEVTSLQYGLTRWFVSSFACAHWWIWLNHAN